MSPEQITALVSSLPNMTIAIFGLYWAFKRLDKMIDIYENVVNALLQAQTKQQEIIAQLVGQGADIEEAQPDE